MNKNLLNKLLSISVNLPRGCVSTNCQGKSNTICNGLCLQQWSDSSLESEIKRVILEGIFNDGIDRNISLIVCMQRAGTAALIRV